jgi:hypothetical protein
LPRSVGFLPVFFPPEGSLGHAPVEALPVPVDADPVVVLAEGDLPQLAKHTPLLPPLEVSVEAAARAELGRRGLPLATGPQDVEDAVEDLAVRQARAAAPGGPPDLGEQRLDPLPQRVRDAKCRGDGVSGGSHVDPPATGESVGTYILPPRFWDRLLGDAVGDFFHSHAGTGRFCAVEAHVLAEVVYFVARVADRLELVEGFTEDGRPALQRVRSSLAVLFAYCPRDGSVRLKAPVRADDRVRDLVQRFGHAVLHEPVTGFGPVFGLDKLNRPALLLPDADDMEAVRVRTLHLRYPARNGRRSLRLETLPGDAPDAMDELL